MTAWVAAVLDKAKFRVCVGVRSGRTMKAVGYVRRGSLDSHQVVRFPYEVASKLDCVGGRNP